MISQAGMQAVLSADASMKQAKVQGNVAKKMENRADVLKIEIRQDGGQDTSAKEAELAQVQQKAESAEAARMSTLAEANRTLTETAKTEATGKEESGAEPEKAEAAGKEENRVESEKREATRTEDSVGKASETGKVGTLLERMISIIPIIPPSLRRENRVWIRIS